MTTEPKRRGRRPGTLCRGKCVVCGTVELARAASQHFRCTECKTAGRFAPFQVPHSWTGQGHAHGVVGRAIRGGELAHPTTLACTDCGVPAQQYDHRDYNKPLDVQPVCRRCNLKRGPAIPAHGSVERLLGEGRIPYRRGSAVRILCQALGRPDLAVGIPPRVDLNDWRRVWPQLIGAPAVPTPETVKG